MLHGSKGAGGETHEHPLARRGQCSSNVSCRSHRPRTPHPQSRCEHGTGQRECAGGVNAYTPHAKLNAEEREPLP